MAQSMLCGGLGYCPPPPPPPSPAQLLSAKVIFLTSPSTYHQLQPSIRTFLLSLPNSVESSHPPGSSHHTHQEAPPGSSHHTHQEAHTTSTSKLTLTRKLTPTREFTPHPPGSSYHHTTTNQKPKFLPPLPLLLLPYVVS